jgi:hypothetical protein
MEGQSMSAVTRRSFLFTGGATAATAAASVTLLAPAAHAATAVPRSRRAPAGSSITVASGQTYTVAATTTVSAVTIEQGGVLTAPAGYSLTMTVNGVETGQVLAATSGAETVFVPGNWRGDIVLTVTEADDITWQQHVYPFRQAIYADSSGLVGAYSVLAAAVGGQVTSAGAYGVRINSTGQCFDGVFVNGGSYTLERPVINLNGNGRCDFVGYGAALVANNTGTTVVVDGAQINNQGAVRTAAIADNGATLVVKNSSLSVKNGVLPADYVPTVNLDTMESAPWMLSIDGNVRATNLLGNNSVAAYVNSSVFSETWGALSTDSGSNCTLVAVNSVVGQTGNDGYGTYVIGNATEYLLGSQFDVGSYASIFTGGSATYGDSDPATVASLNASLGLGLTNAELRALRPRPTVVNSRRFGFMNHQGTNTLTITGGTVINSPHATFLNKGQQWGISVDGSRGAKLTPGDGILVQVMDNDDPGPVVVNGVLENAGVYTQPTGEPTKDPTFDVTVVHPDSDSVFSFSDIELTGNFYNGLAGGPSSGPAGPGGGAANGLNLVLNLAASRVVGTITATLATHFVDTITSANWWELGKVSNVAQPAINNGVIVALTGGSRWTVAGTSYLTALSLDASSSVSGPGRKHVTMTVDGTVTEIEPGGSYTGAIVLTVT